MTIRRKVIALLASLPVPAVALAFFGDRLAFRSAVSCQRAADVHLRLREVTGGVPPDVASVAFARLDELARHGTLFDG
jgi:hypothetical protein